MCTVTVVRAESKVRVACNRDERIGRPLAQPPAFIAIGGRRVLMPIDPEGGGTWIAATDAGLVFVVLNVSKAARRSLGGRGQPRRRDEPKGSCHKSRGLIIPRLVHCPTPDAAVAEMQQDDWSAFAPFRLVAVSRTRQAEAVWDGRRLTTRRRRLRTPFMRTSSGLGDDLVRAPRGRLFRRLVSERGDRRAAQDRFHGHFWASRPHLSVLMSRPGARTVSQTVVELGATRAAMRYTERPR